jgi:hypothetical protein
MATSKKDFSTGAAAIFSSTSNPGAKDNNEPGAGSAISEEVTSTKKGLKLGETRRTYILNEDIAEDLDRIAFWERTTIKDVVNEAVKDYVNRYVLDNKNKQNVLPSLRVKPVIKRKGEG